MFKISIFYTEIQYKITEERNFLNKAIYDGLVNAEIY